MSQGHRPTAWLSQQRHVPARCEERDYPAFRPVELIDMAISDDERDFWWLVEMPGNSDNDPVGAIGFTVFGMKQNKNSEITLDLPTVCKIDPANTPTFPALLYVKDASTIDDAVLTTEKSDAIDGGPTFLSSRYYREERDLVMVDQMLGGGGTDAKTKLVKPLSAKTGPNIITECAIYTGALGSETLSGDSLIGFARHIDTYTEAFWEAKPVSSRSGGEPGGGTSSVSADEDHPSGFIGPADHEIAPWGCES